ncbi:MAG: hypothetical protein A2527_12860 [Candidatus Lambdaproteobacteria bacterium RIFOXYD2_FULL_50_16]|uniref:Uncharacterized protein n=1 Tax=Candidatus Lambdaproteobacteria bacterium RIFOXYD2_FULL_50_16 TaxID=1817772 RepID=A0A1F6G9Q3_9PROT|nr:MAG: hypothetical protein A2527_12860 [Candidatus Lambdaproteobacteria bacterium RIFOXYD2_FULL_50_16]
MKPALLLLKKYLLALVALLLALAFWLGTPFLSPYLVSSPALQKAEGLRAYYPLTSDLKDHSNQAPNLVYPGKNPLFAHGGLQLTGKPGSFVMFDGWGQHQTPNAQEQTISFWMIRFPKTLEQHGYQGLFWDGDVRDTRKPRHSFWFNQDIHRWHHSISKVDGFDSDNSIMPVDRAFITSVVSYKEKKAYFYLNGKLWDSSNLKLENFPPSTYLYFGKSWTPETLFRGVIGGVTLWDRAITAEEAARLYDQQNQTYQTIDHNIGLIDGLAVFLAILLFGFSLYQIARIPRAVPGLLLLPLGWTTQTLEKLAKPYRMLGLTLLILALFQGVARLLRLVPAGDAFQYAYSQYIILNELVSHGELIKWLPFMTEGMIANIWAFISFSLSYPWVLGLHYLTGLQFDKLLYLGYFIDETIFVVGLFLLARRLFKRSEAILFVTATAAFTLVWYGQPWFNFKLFHLFPLALFFLITGLERRQVTRLVIAAWLAVTGVIGALPYYLPILEMMFLASCLGFAPYHIKSKKDLVALVSPKGENPFKLLLALGLLGSSLYVIYAFNKLGVEEISHLNMGRSEDGRVALKDFLVYGLDTDWRKYLEMVTAISPNREHQFFAGLLTLPLALFALTNKSARQGRYFWAWVGLSGLTLGFSSASPVSVLMYKLVPMMDYYRHIGFIDNFQKIFMLILAGFGIEHLLEREPGDFWANEKAFWALNLSLLFGLGVLVYELLTNWIGYSWIFDFSKSIHRVTIGALANEAWYVKPAYNLGIALSLILFLLIFWLVRVETRPKARQGLLVLLVLVHLGGALTYRIVYTAKVGTTVSPEAMATLEFAPYSYPDHRTQNYLTSKRYQAWQTYLYFPDHFPILPTVTDYFLFIHTFHYGPHGSTYWSSESFHHVDACYGIYRTDQALRHLRRLKTIYGQYMLSEGGRDLLTGPVDDQYYRLTGCYRSKLRLYPEALVLADDQADAWFTDRGPDRLLVSSETVSATKGALTGFEPNAGLVQSPELRSEAGSKELKVGEEVAVTGFSANHLELDLTGLNEAERKGFLYLAYPWHPEWKAWVDGQEVPLLRAQLGYMAVPIGGGKQVTFRLVEPKLDAAYLAFGLMSLGFWAVLLYTFWRERR